MVVANLDRFGFRKVKHLLTRTRFVKTSHQAIKAKKRTPDSERPLIVLTILVKELAFQPRHSTGFRPPR
jgi:hypothetical protein